MSSFLILGSDSYVGQCLIEIFKKTKYLLKLLIKNYLII